MTGRADASAISGHTRVAGIIGDPVRHSLSPAIHNAAFEAAGLDWVFVAFPVPDGQAAAALAAMRTLEIGGLSVTMPHKEPAAAACDDLSERSRRLRSVNCVVRRRDGSLYGDSTDGEGFLRSLADAGVEVAGMAALVLGAGGAGRAVALALAEAGASVTVAARRPDAGDAAADLGGGRAVSIDAVASELGAVELVVNATPVGMTGDASPLDPALLSADHIVADLVYHPAETPLLAAAERRGARTVGGIGMLVHQAALAFTLWTGQDAPVEVMRAAAEARRAELSS